MGILALDVGSSSVKGAILHADSIRGKVARSAFPTRYAHGRAEVEPRDVMRALADTIAQLGPAARRAQTIALSVMAPSWLAMDKRGRPLTPIITHQDRRSTAEALDLEKRVGKRRHLRLCGNRPFPGGISSTTFLWYSKHEKSLMRKADLVGHLQTYLHLQLTGSRVADPSNASFMGVYSTFDLSGWNEELMAATGVSEHQLPQLMDADAVAGMVTRPAARQFGLTHGTPMLVGCMDTSAAMLLAGTRAGQMLNVCGSTDVLAICADRFRPHERLLTRALGVGRRWMSVSTLAAGGASLTWAREQFFPDLPWKQFCTIVHELAEEKPGDVTFDPYLAGERTSVEQRRAALTELTLSTTRRDILRAIVHALATASAARLKTFADAGLRPARAVVLSGGVTDSLPKVFHRDWPGRWTFRPEPEATLRGLARLAP